MNRTYFTTKRQLDQLRNRYDNLGWTMAELADNAGCSIPTVRDALVRAGATIRPRGRRPAEA